ncbi:MAG: nitroreductase family protein [Candidatus Izemoplasmatales bacterium]|nr:nitroreductase family protein [Candidatus Izemoplasmatales bacterium]
MDYFDLIEKRESCRNFDGTPIEKHLITRCLEATRLAPSACNGQPWRFIVVTKPESVAALSRCMQPFNRLAGAMIVILEAKPSLMTSIGNQLKDQDFTQIDIGIAASYLTLAATELGLSSCIVGWFDEKAVRSQFKVPKNQRIRLIISLGYTHAPQPRPKRRKTLQDLILIED